MPYQKSWVLPYAWATASPGVAHARTKVSLKCAFSFQSAYPSSSEARLLEVTPGA